MKRVTWVVDVEAETAVGAAKEALAMQRDPDSIATVFDVSDDDGSKVRVDLTEGTTEVIQTECKGKAAARALAVLVLDPKVYAWLFDHDRKALQQAENALVPFGYPDADALRAKLITQK